MAEDTGSIISSLTTERDQLKEHCKRLQRLMDQMGYPPGHYYSPLVDSADIAVRRAVYDRSCAQLPAGVTLDLTAMQLLLRRFALRQKLWPFPARKTSRYRYYYDNPFFACHDASVYFCALLEFRPRRVIEIGAGFSSCLLLDTREHFLGDTVEVTLIDPSLERLDQLTDAAGLPGVSVLERRLQDVPLDTFEQLGPNDILFVDSSHVAKTASDVNRYMFEILPRLGSGVLIHVHDILYPFEYPEPWVIDEKRSWNEAYLLHAFLQYNSTFEILYWNNFVYHKSQDLLRSLMPLCLENEGGSLWMRKK